MIARNAGASGRRYHKTFENIVGLVIGGTLILAMFIVAGVVLLGGALVALVWEVLRGHN